MSSIPMHASCHGNRSGEAFLKDPVKHLEYAGLRETECQKRESGRDVSWTIVPLFIHIFFSPSIISVNYVGKFGLFGFRLQVLFLLIKQHSWKS